MFTSGRADPQAGAASYRSARLQSQFDELTAKAETLVAVDRPALGPRRKARAKVTDPPGGLRRRCSSSVWSGHHSPSCKTERTANIGGPSLVIGRGVAACSWA